MLGKGWHSILVKADRQEGHWTLHLRVVTPDGARLAGLKIRH